MSESIAQPDANPLQAQWDGCAHHIRELARMMAPESMVDVEELLAHNELGEALGILSAAVDAPQPTHCI